MVSLLLVIVLLKHDSECITSKKQHCFVFLSDLSSVLISPPEARARALIARALQQIST